MRTITDVVQGSGYHELRLDDNSVVRVQDDVMPTGYVPAAGDTVEIDGDGVVSFSGGVAVAPPVESVELGVAGEQSETDHD